MNKILCALLLSLPLSVAIAGSKNGFDLSDALIPEHEILKGGPPRDGIPAINFPKFESAEVATWLDGDDRVLGVVINGQARAYPVPILNYHEIVNDRIGDQHFAVTYCPLCGTGIVFSSDLDGESLQFGVSGLLYNSDVLLFDRNSNSLFSQIMAKGITGRFKGFELERLPVSHTSWQNWLERHPGTEILSRETGFRRDYGRTPYDDYDKIRRLYFQVSNRAPDDYHPKEQVLGVEIGSSFKAYPFAELKQLGQSRFSDHLATQDIEITWNEKANSAQAFDSNDDEIATVIAFWFAWYAFHPETEVFKAEMAPDQ
jgi:hypothetical protein